MANRLDIELTSRKDDGSWTWRVIGAKHPKGVIPPELVSDGQKVGDSLRVEAEFSLDGIEITAVLPPKARKAQSSDEIRKIEILGSRVDSKDSPLVTTTLVGKSGRTDRDNSPNGRNAKNRTRSDQRRPTRPQFPGGSDGGGGGGGAGPSHRDGTSFKKDHRRSEFRPQPDSVDRPSDRGRRATPSEFSKSAGRRPNGPRGSAGAGRGPSPSTGIHRKALLDSLTSEQKAIADKLIAGGLAAVRKAIEDQNSSARQQNQPEVPQEPLIAMAENLLPRLTIASWCDRAEAILADIDAVPLRELRSTVSASEGAQREEPGRTLLQRLRDAADTKVRAVRERWEGQVSQLLEDGQIVRALRASATPPDPGARIPAELATKLALQASVAMNSETPAPRWILLLEAAAASPVRVNIRPSGIPDNSPGELVNAARKHAGRIPSLAKLLGIALPPPPSPIAQRKRLEDSNRGSRTSVPRGTLDSQTKRRPQIQSTGDKADLATIDNPPNESDLIQGDDVGE